MTYAQKVSASLLFTVLLFSAFCVAAFSRLFSLIETRFYEPMILNAYETRLQNIEEATEEYYATLRTRFASYANDSRTLTFLEKQADDDTSKARTELTGSLLSETYALTGIRIADANGKNIHFSTYESDLFASSDTMRSYRNYKDIESVAFTELSATVLHAKSGTPANVYMDDAKNRLIFVMPVKDLAGIIQAFALFYCNPDDLNRFLLSRNLISVYENAALVKNSFVFAFPTVGADILKNAIREQLSAQPSAQDKLDIRRISDTAQASWLLVLHHASDGLALGWLCKSDDVAFPRLMQILLLAIVFMTLYLVIFLLFNLRHDDMLVIRKRIRQFQRAFINEYFERGLNANATPLAEELLSRMPELSKDIKRSLGRRAKKHEAEINALFDKGWDEVMTAFGHKNDSAQTAISADDIKRMLEEVIRTTTLHIQQTAPESIPAAPAPEAQNEPELLPEPAPLSEPEPIPEPELLTDADLAAEVPLAEDAPADDVPVAEVALADDAPAEEDALADDVPLAEDAPADDVLPEEAELADDVPVAEESPAENMPLAEEALDDDALPEEAVLVDAEPLAEVAPADDVPLAEVAHADDAPVAEDVSADDVLTEDAAPAEDAPADDVLPEEEVPADAEPVAEELPAEDMPLAEDALTDDVPPAEAVPVAEDMPAEDAEPPTEVAPADDVPADDVPVAEELPAENMPLAEDAPADDVSLTEVAHADDAPVAEDVSADDVLTEDAAPAEAEPVDEVPLAEDAPADDVPVAEVALADDAPAEEVPLAEDVPADAEPVAEELPAEDMPLAEEAPADDALSEGVASVDDVPIAEDAPSEVALADDVPVTEELPAENMPLAENALAEETAPADDVLPEEVALADDAHAEDVLPEEDALADAVPADDVPVAEVALADDALPEKALAEDAVTDAEPLAEEAPADDALPEEAASADNVPDDAEAEGILEALEIDEEKSSLFSLGHTEYGAELSELPTATDVILADEDGVFCITENLPESKLPVDTSFANLIHSVMTGANHGI